MRWYRAYTYRREVVGTDETRNPVTELVETGDSILVRTPPWTREKDNTEGNRFDVVDRTFITKAKPELLEGIAAVKIGERLYTVEGASHEANTVTLSVRRCKDGEQSG